MSKELNKCTMLVGEKNIWGKKLQDWRSAQGP